MLSHRGKCDCAGLVALWAHGRQGGLRNTKLLHEAETLAVGLCFVLAENVKTCLDFFHGGMDRDRTLETQGQIST